MCLHRWLNTQADLSNLSDHRLSNIKILQKYGDDKLPAASDNLKIQRAVWPYVVLLYYIVAEIVTALSGISLTQHR